MFGLFKKKKQPDERFSQPLSPEADKFLAEALEEYGQKEEALEQGWRLSQGSDYDLDDTTGTFRLRFSDGTAWEADAQILGSFNEADQGWQWAWATRIVRRCGRTTAKPSRHWGSNWESGMFTRSGTSRFPGLSLSLI